jgi:hypothetical protein
MKELVSTESGSDIFIAPRRVPWPLPIVSKPRFTDSPPPLSGWLTAPTTAALSMMEKNVVTDLFIFFDCCISVLRLIAKRSPETVFQ